MKNVRQAAASGVKVQHYKGGTLRVATPMAAALVDAIPRCRQVVPSPLQLLVLVAQVGPRLLQAMEGRAQLIDRA